LQVIRCEDGHAQGAERDLRVSAAHRVTVICALQARLFDARQAIVVRERMHLAG
jgi:hypothetical protein